MKSDIENVRSYYDFDPLKEWNRMNGQYSDIEFYVVQRKLSQYLKPNSIILDLGCGSGRHSIELAKRGHKVVMVDISKKSLNFAMERFHEEGLESQILDVVCCPAETYMNNQIIFDAVLAFGPFYHIIDDEKLAQCINNIKSYTNHQSYIFIICIQFISLFKDFLKRAWFDKLRHQIDEGYLKTGIYIPQSEQDVMQYMPEFRAFTFESIQSLLNTYSFNVIDMITCEGFAAFMRPYIEKQVISKELYSQMLELIYETADQIFVRNSTDHFLVVSKQK